MDNRIGLLVTTAFLMTPAAFAEAPVRWPQFHGVGGAGLAAEGSKVPREFGPDKNVLWTTPLPRGHSSPCIWGERIFLTGCEKGSKNLETICLDRATGAIRWKKSVPADKNEPIHELNSLASSTPATDGEFVYVYFGKFGLVCYDMDGKEIWQRPFAPIPGRFGSGQSPAVAGEFVLLNTGTNNFAFTLSAFDRKTGKTMWEKGRSRGFSSSLASTPMVRPIPGGHEVLALGGQKVCAYNLADGAERWTMTGLPPVSLNTPVIGDNLAVFTLSNPFGDSENVVALPSFDDALKKYDANADGKIQFAEVPADLTMFTRGREDKIGDWNSVRDTVRVLDRDKDGALDRDEWQTMLDQQARFTEMAVTTTYCVRLDVAAEASRIVWQQSKSAPEVPSPLIYRGRVYLISEKGFVTCRDLKTGRELYRERLGTRGICYASPVAGDGVILACSDGGTVVILNEGDKFDVVGKVQFQEPILATPALVDNKVYLRTAKQLFAFGN